MAATSPVSTFIDADQKDLSSIVLVHDRQFSIPLNQRPWAWNDAKDVQNLLDDFYKTLAVFYDKTSTPKWKAIMGSARPPHFFGTLVFFKKSNDQLEVFDGQQRLTAITMMCAILRELAHELVSKDSKHSNLVGAFNDWLHISPTSDAPRLVPNKFYQPLFDALISKPLTQSDRDVALSALDPSLADHAVAKKLIKSFQHIRAWLRETVASLTNEETADFLTASYETLRTNFCCIETIIHDEQYAYEVFGCLNARGEKLSEADKIKNELFLKSTKSDHAHISDTWTRIGENILNQEIGEFLRRRHIALHDPCKKQEVYEQVRRGEIESSSSIRQLVDEWKVDSDRIHSLITRKSGYAKAETLSRIESIFDILSVSLAQIPLLAAARKLLPTDKDAFEKCVEAIEKYVFRSITIQKLDTSELERILGEAARRINAGGKSSDLVDFLRGKTNDVDFENAFASHTETRTKVQFYILRKIETQLLGGGAGVIPGDHHAAKNHIEHILPRNLSRSASRLGEWSWARAHPDKHKKLVNRLGNLLILEHDINKEVSNHEFDVKRGDPFKKAKSGASKPLKKCFKDSALKWPQDLCNKAKWPDWTEVAIEQRQKTMAQEAVKIWKI